VSYLHEFEHLTFSALLIATNEVEQSLALLRRLSADADAGQRFGSLVDILVLQAVAANARGDSDDADAFLARALDLAAPDVRLQVFIDEEAALRPILRRLVLGDGVSPLAHSVHASLMARAASDGMSLVESLTAREVEILRLLASGLRNQEVADALVISVATVKRHMANTYGKLGAAHRTEAIAKATELGIL